MPRRSFPSVTALLRQAIALLSVSSIATVAALAAPPDKGFGTNLHGVADWAPALPFADVIKQSGQWLAQREGVQQWDTGEPLELDPDDWPRLLLPGQQAATVVMHGARYPAGEYSLTYQGRGVVEPIFDARAHDKRGNRLTVNVLPADMVALKLLKSDERDPVRNIRFLLPGIDATKPAPTFNPVYLETLAPYKVLRFMNWANTDTTSVEHWSDRTRPDHASQARPAGVAIEYMIELAQTVGAIPWFNVPHAADDTYVREMARLIKAMHGADAKFYLEYSNEFWNSAQPLHVYFLKESARRGMKSIDEFYVRRALQVFAIFEQVFEKKDVIVRVLAGQSANAGRNQEMLGLVDLRGRVDAFAIAPYFASYDDLVGRDGDLRAVPIADLIARAERSLMRVRNEIRTARRQAQHAGVELIAYEGGQHVTAPNDKQGVCTRLNRHEAMEALYKQYLELWTKEAAGALMVLFMDMSKFGVHGCWGLKEFHGQRMSQTPKLRAVLDFLQANGQR